MFFVEECKIFEVLNPLCTRIEIKFSQSSIADLITFYPKIANAYVLLQNGE